MSFCFAEDPLPSSKQELTSILGIVDMDISVDNYHRIIGDWLAEEKHPDFKKPFTALVYQPMLEVIQFFQKNEFKTYIVSGGGKNSFALMQKRSIKFRQNGLLALL